MTDYKWIPVLVLLNPCVILSIALPLSPYQPAGTGRLSDKLFPKEDKYLQNREDSKPYSWGSDDTHKLSHSNERALYEGNIQPHFQVNADRGLDTRERETKLQLLQDILEWDKKRLEDFKRAQPSTNDKREQRCPAGYLGCLHSRDEAAKRETLSQHMVPETKEGLRMDGMDKKDKQQHELEVEKAIRELEWELHGGK